jgi:2-polyprenyl-6-methoxyphenol hydroxylase-like FAD-dependent oxidoreductase
MKVIIVGAGYGGLSSAIACCRQGFDVIVFEQAPQFMRVLSEIGTQPLNTSSETVLDSARMRPDSCCGGEWVTK